MLTFSESLHYLLPITNSRGRNHDWHLIFSLPYVYNFDSLWTRENNCILMYQVLSCDLIINIIFTLYLVAWLFGFTLNKPSVVILYKARPGKRKIAEHTVKRNFFEGKSRLRAITFMCVNCVCYFKNLILLRWNKSIQCYWATWANHVLGIPVSAIIPMRPNKAILCVGPCGRGTCLINHIEGPWRPYLLSSADC